MIFQPLFRLRKLKPQKHRALATQQRSLLLEPHELLAGSRPLTFGDSPNQGKSSASIASRRPRPFRLCQTIPSNPTKFTAPVNLPNFWRIHQVPCDVSPTEGARSWRRRPLEAGPETEQGVGTGRDATKRCRTRFEMERDELKTMPRQTFPGD